MAREPEPLERVRALVCEPCWVNCFDTEGFEKLGRGDVDKFEYKITGENIQAGLRTGCTWCSMVYQVYSGLKTSAKSCEIRLYTNVFHVITPPGRNLYGFQLRADTVLHRSQGLEFFTEYDNFAAQQVTARAMDGDVAPSKTYPQISRWLKECVQHPCCAQIIDSALPTRLIEVETGKICHTNGTFGKFVALSYCWGTGSQIQLRTDTIGTLMQNFNFDHLPQTIKDAILVTRSLSIRYLWVDALCIIQDDAEDQACEIGSMAEIYSNAYITILASSAGDAAHGFLADRHKVEKSTARIPFRVAPKKFGSIMAREHVPLSSSIKQNPLSTRAWALQEQIMASRILAYTKHTLEWRCAAGIMNLNNSLNVNSGFEPESKLISQLSTDPEEALSEWLKIVEDYSRRQTSLQSDKLPAIAALAERFAAVLGHYYAGLWRYEIIKQLCWNSTSYPQRQRVGNSYRAPSWSWASVEGISMRNQPYEEDCCNLISAVVVPKNAQVPYGEVAHASIKICGRVFIASVERAGNYFYPMRTLDQQKNGVVEPLLQTFYKTYFQQDTKNAGLGRGSAFEAHFSWDYEDCRSDPLIVLLVPLTKWLGIVQLAELCQGLVLIPAGPGILRRIGTFGWLREREIGDVVVQEITIV